MTEEQGELFGDLDTEPRGRPLPIQPFAREPHDGSSRAWPQDRFRNHRVPSGDEPRFAGVPLLEAVGLANGSASPISTDRLQGRFEVMKTAARS